MALARCVVLKNEVSWLPVMRKTGVFLFCFLLNKLAVFNLAGWTPGSDSGMSNEVQKTTGCNVRRPGRRATPKFGYSD